MVVLPERGWPSWVHRSPCQYSVASIRTNPCDGPRSHSAGGRRGKEWTSVVSIPTDGETGDVEDQVDISSSSGDQPTEPPENLDAAGRARYLAEVMAEIDAEVKRRRASGDLPAGLERELDELFLEFSPVGHAGQGAAPRDAGSGRRRRLRGHGRAGPLQQGRGVYIKRLIRKSTSWYMGFVVHQIVRFAWSVVSGAAPGGRPHRRPGGDGRLDAGTGAARVGGAPRRCRRFVVGAHRHRCGPWQRRPGAPRRVRQRVPGRGVGGRRGSMPTGWIPASRRSSRG